MRRNAHTVTVLALTVGGLVIAAAAILWPVLAYAFPSSSTATSDPVRITSYDATFDVDDEGTLHAVETITAQFPSGRHGIFRFFDTTVPWDGHVRLIPEDIKVTLDGASEPLQLLWERGRHYRVAKIGSANRTVSAGSHVYTISYRIEGALAPATAGGGGGQSGSWASDEEQAVFYWNVVAGGWQMSIGDSRSTVTLPAAIDGEVQCVTGFDNSGSCDLTTTADGLIVSTDALAPRTPVTVRVPIDMAAPGQKRLPWTPAYDGVFGQSVPLAVGLGLLGILGFLVGRGWEWRTREDTPGYPVMYEPPQGMGPVQTYYVMHEKLPSHALVASLLHQAEAGLTRLVQRGQKDWLIEAQAGDWTQVDPVTRRVGEALALTTPGATFAADGSVEAGKKLQGLGSSMRSATRSWARQEHLVVSRGTEWLGKGLVLAAALIAGLLAVFRPGAMTLWALPFAAFAVGGVGMLLAGVGTRRTAAGRQAWSRAGGFHRLLSTPSAQDRFDFSANKDLYTAFIPYAVAFDCADEWAAKYRVQTGEEPPVPNWYVGAAGYSFATSRGAFSGFESSLSSSISAYQATQSSSGGGGGGFSGGGGGGGGGGGSW